MHRKFSYAESSERKHRNAIGARTLRTSGEIVLYFPIKKTIDIGNSRKTKDGLYYALKAMIICGLNPDIEEMLKFSDLSIELQKIIEHNNSQFDGSNPEPCNIISLYLKFKSI